MYTVDSILTDTPNSGRLPNYGHCCMNTRIADNLRVPDNGHGGLHAVIQLHTKLVLNNGQWWSSNYHAPSGLRMQSTTGAH